MKLRVLIALAALGVAAGSLTDAAAAEKARAKGKKPPEGTLEKDIKLAPEGIRWGMTVEHLAKIYDRYFDEVYLPKYKRVEPGVQMDRLDAEVKEKKDLIRRSWIDFGDTPTGVDNTPLP